MCNCSENHHEKKTDYYDKSEGNHYEVWYCLRCSASWHVVVKCPSCLSDNVGYVPMSKVLHKTHKCLNCQHEWQKAKDE